MTDALVELYLIRHAQTFLNVDHTTVVGRSNEEPITSVGEDQARFLGRCLLDQGLVPDEVITSPAVRAQMTGAIVLEAMGSPLTMRQDDGLQEMSQGDWVGRRRDEVYSSVTRAEIMRLGKDFKAPNGESTNETGQRMFDAIMRIAERAVSTSTDGGNPRRIFVITHGNAIKSLASRILGWDNDQTYRFVVDNVSVSLLTLKHGCLQVEYLAVPPDQLPARQ